MTDVKSYKDTLFLPITDFPMKAGLPLKEPEVLARWNERNLYKTLRSQSKGRKPYVLHDGPPYANGDLHIGHALNKILKDVVVRSRQMMGYDANYVAGWDCHGLPIEWKIEEKYRAEGKNKDEVDLLTLRSECRAFASQWLDVQRESFKRLGIVGDWENPYTTMAFKSESVIAGELLKFAMTNQLYRSSKPVFWSCVEKTALADAEVEYHEHTSPAIWVRFPVKGYANRSAVIWTTTPWTMPANLALAYSEGISYGVYRVDELGGEAWAEIGEELILADVRVADVMKAARVSGYTRLQDATDLGSFVAQHPLNELGGVFAHDRRFIAGDFVTDVQGTGFVHIAPGHGEDDYGLWVHQRSLFPEEYAKDLPHTVQPDGRYYPSVPYFGGLECSILSPDGKMGTTNDLVMNKLIESGGLLARGRLKHNYPHSWRSKAPLIFRNTAQWFISMSDEKGCDSLRQKALAEIAKTTFYPSVGRNRLSKMIETRPDWVISRQRAWGVPIPLFVNKVTGQILQDDAVNARILKAFTEKGADAWFAEDPTAFFPDFNPEQWEQVHDILDVWFDSGCTHAFVLEERDDLSSPADLYLEGSDQHRGWFHSSLLESVGTRGKAPYKAVLTHGFVLDEKGEKMSKSRGNVVTPQEVVQKHGADILRLWVITSDYNEDLRIGQKILETNSDTYRRLRNTLRWVLGALNGFTSDKAGSLEKTDHLPLLEQWVLHRLSELDTLVREGYEKHEYGRVFQQIFQFCTNDLSAFYADVRKDVLYCDGVSSPRRVACQTVLEQVFRCLTLWLAPVLCFTMDEVWTQRHQGDCVHLHGFPDLPKAWKNQYVSQEMDLARRVRRVVTSALEEQRREKVIGASLEAAPVVYCTNPDLIRAFEAFIPDEICLTSGLTFKVEQYPQGAFTLPEEKEMGVIFHKAHGEKCERCWKILPEVGQNATDEKLCGRCHEAVHTA
jgi:isoleucyl-tRNA synthetase